MIKLKTLRIGDLLVPKNQIISFIYIDNKVKKWDELFAKYKYRIDQIKNETVTLKFYDLQDDLNKITIPTDLIKTALRNNDFYVLIY